MSGHAIGKARDRRAFAAEEESLRRRARERRDTRTLRLQVADSRAAILAAEQIYRTRTRRLDDHEVTLGRAVIAGGRPGTIHAVARSLATDRTLITVAHDPRIRITYPRDEVLVAL